MPESATRDTITAVWRDESGPLIAALTRMTRDVGLAEDLAQDAFVTALEQWPTSGIPANPAAWLMTTAKRRAIDTFRRADTLRRKTAELERTAGEVDPMPDLTSQVDHIEDDVLRLMFLCCHPSLTADSRAALTLRMVGGLTTVEIARGFLVADATMGQRIARAKKTLTDAKAEFELPTGADRIRRLDDVMAVIYLVFNEGYAATAGEDWTRPDLAAEGIRLARMLTGLVPDEPEVHGLQALLELQASRLHARTDSAGNPLLLDDQDRSRWDHLLIRRGVTALKRAEDLAARGVPVGRYFLQAQIAHEHARTTTAEDTNWPRIAALYDLLREAAPGPVVEVNRAVAHGRALGPAAGMAVLDAVPDDALGSSPLIPSVRGDLLSRSGDHAGAAEQFDEAARRTQNDAERLLLQGRASQSRAAQ
ncbi:RNA polymerase sigma factor [Nocardioides sp. WS12]|uniref:RNA polymerase sigma factor n=1 Tax=Nocardioides sp. WS12 TaxID=2486272 RepID=UPI0015F91E0D|nr:RNA polymerase sigma factor [Nocardioides sp. WS12]